MEQPSVILRPEFSCFPLICLLEGGLVCLLLAGTVACGSWAPFLLAVAVCAATAGFIWWRTGQQVDAYRDHLVFRTRLGVTRVELAGATAQLRRNSYYIQRYRAHQPVVCLRRQGKVLASIPATAYRKEDVAALVSFLETLELSRSYMD